jgi:large subunit ribosomal protein L4
MIELSVYNRSGKEVDKISVDEAVLGGAVRYALLKQAIVMHHANQRVGTVQTKSRGMVAGSDKKLYRQKGTGNARVGNRRTGVRVGGGMIFGKVPRDFSQKMPRKQKRLARDSAVLAKLKKNGVVVIDGLPSRNRRRRTLRGS